MLGDESRQEKLLSFILEEKKKQERWRTLEKLGEKWIYECIEMFIKGREKSVKNGIKSAWFVGREGNVGY